MYAFAPYWRHALNFQQYPWHMLTDVCLFGDGILSGELHSNESAMQQLSRIRYIAQRHGVRLSGSAFLSPTDLAEPTGIVQWVSRIAGEACRLQLDAVNVDIELPVAATNVQQRRAVTQTVAELRVALQKCRHGPMQLAFDAAWSPSGVDGRFYDLPAIARHVDFIFVMAYDVQSQMWSQACTAEANSPAPLVWQGLQEYRALGIPEQQLVLGLPWYGYKYSCVNRNAVGPKSRQDADIATHAHGRKSGGAQNELATGMSTVCQIPAVKFRGAPCSDAAGAQVPYSNIMAVKRIYGAHLMWDEHAASPYMDLTGANHSKNGMHRIVFDNPESLKRKYLIAHKMALRGVGFWHIDALDWSGCAVASRDRAAMFSAIEVFASPSETHRPLRPIEA